MVSVAEKLLRNIKVPSNAAQQAQKEKEKGKTTVSPYIHKISHNLKKVANRVDVKVFFSAPDKLAKLCQLTNKKDREKKVLR